MAIFKIFESEIKSYLTEKVEISEGYKFNQYKLIKRIMLYQNNIYPTGKLTKQGDYKQWIDIIQPRVDSEVKNIDFDTSAIQYYSESYRDAGYMLLCNLALDEWMKDNQQGEELNDAIEEFSSWGNVVWKKVKGGYERVSLKDFYVINQQAKTLNETPVIERHIFTQSDLRKKIGVWKNVEQVIENCGNMGYTRDPEGVQESKENPYYEIYERNGEVSEYDLFQAQGKEGGSKKKYILAKIIGAGLKKSSPNDKGKYILFAEALGSMPYKEAHRGRYNGRWFRVGIIEMLFDIQTRANEISNQIARGLEWASKTIFRTQDNLLAQNILTDMENGDVIRSTDLQQIDIRMHGLDQLIADWNRLMDSADKLTNSYEIVTGESMPSGTPFRLGAMMNQNANKLYEYIREKLSLGLQDVFQDWIMPDMIRNLKAKDVLRLTGDPAMMNRYYDMVVNSWYVKNLLKMPPHGEEVAETLKAKKREEIMKNPEQLIKLEDGWLDGVKPRITVVISGENISMTEDLQTLATFIQLEVDPVRRTALIERAMKRKGIDVEDLPKSPPPPDPSQMGMEGEGGPGVGSKLKMAMQGQMSPNKEMSQKELSPQL